MFSGLSKVFSLGNLQNAYEGAGKAVKWGYHAISKPVRGFGHLIQNADHYLNMANRIPLLSNLSRLVQGNPIWQEILATNTDVQSLLDVVEKSGDEVDEIAKRLLRLSQERGDESPASFNVQSPSVILEGQSAVEQNSGVR